MDADKLASDLLGSRNHYYPDGLYFRELRPTELANAIRSAVAAVAAERDEARQHLLARDSECAKWQGELAECRQEVERLKERLRPHIEDPGGYLAVGAFVTRIKEAEERAEKAEADAAVSRMAWRTADESRAKAEAECGRLKGVLREVLVYMEHPEGEAPNGWRLTTAMDAIRAALASSEPPTCANGVPHHFVDIGGQQRCEVCGIYEHP